MKILTKIEIFDNFDENRNFFGNLNKNEILTKIESFHRFDQNRKFRNFQKNRNISNIWPKWKFFEIFEKIEIFCKFWPKSKFLENFGKFWLKSIFFSKFVNNDGKFPKNWPQIFFFVILTKIEIITKFWPKSKILENFNQKQNFSQS